MRRIALLALLVFTFSRCSDDDNVSSADGNTAPVAVQYSVIKDNILSGDPVPEGKYLIKSQADLQAFKNIANAAYSDGHDEFADIAIDFTLYDAIAVIDAWHPGGGYDISVTGISRVDNVIKVTVAKTGTGDATTVVTQPYQIIRLQKVNYPLTFEVNAPQ